MPHPVEWSFFTGEKGEEEKEMWLICGQASYRVNDEGEQCKNKALNQLNKTLYCYVTAYPQWYIVHLDELFFNSIDFN